MEASKPKWVNPVLNTIGVNSLRLGGLQITYVDLALCIEGYFYWTIDAADFGNQCEFMVQSTSNLYSSLVTSTSNLSVLNRLLLLNLSLIEEFLKLVI